jgi:AcrR family transcriptional regulator
MMDRQEKNFERVNQKRRTRTELLRAARDLIANGGHPSVGDVADRASISRATAYRYFSTPEELVREAVLDGVADTILVPPAADGEGSEVVPKRLDDLVTQVFKMVVDNEHVFRALLAGSATGQSSAKRGGRRLEWLRLALDPLRQEVPKAQFERLIQSLALVTGVEALVVTRDICELDYDQSDELLRWTARTLLRGAIAESFGPEKTN